MKYIYHLLIVYGRSHSWHLCLYTPMLLVWIWVPTDSYETTGWMWGSTVPAGEWRTTKLLQANTSHMFLLFTFYFSPLSFPSLLCLSSLLCFIQDTAQLQVVGRSSRSIATFETSSVPLQYSGSLNSLGEPHSPSSSDEEREDLFNEWVPGCLLCYKQTTIHSSRSRVLYVGGYYCTLSLVSGSKKGACESRFLNPPMTPCCFLFLHW